MNTYNIGFNPLCFQKGDKALYIHGNQYGGGWNAFQLSLDWFPIMDSQFDNGLSEHGEIHKYVKSTDEDYPVKWLVDTPN